MKGIIMFKRQWIIVLVILCLNLPFLIYADDEFEWGEISDEELMMQGIPEDPEANAVILFHLGELRITPDFGMEFFVHKRVKILTELGKEYANIEIPVYYKNKIYDLKAESYSPEGKKTKLDDDNVFEEKINRFWNKKVFAVPGVEVGSVFEYKYQVTSESIYQLEPWVFQDHEHTKFSQITVYLPAGFTYSGLTMNLLPDDYEQTYEKVRNPYDFDKDCALYKWTVRELPGIKKEPYMKAFDDYLAKILFQLVSFKNQYVNREFAKHWDDVAEEVWIEYKDHFNQDGGLEDFTKELVAGITDPIEQTKKIYNYVRRDIRTNGKGGLWGDAVGDPKNVFKNKEGSSNEKNILFINMLKQVDIEAMPVLISTRSNGQFNQDWVNLQQFNRVVACVDIGQKKYFLNTGSKYCPFSYLTPDYDVDYGFIVNNKKGQIIKINAPEPDNKLEIESLVNLDENGEINVYAHFTFEGINAVLERDKIENKDLNEYLEGQIDDIHQEAVLDSFHYAAMDSCSKPLELDLYFHVPGYLEEAGTISYCRIPLLTGRDKNPFVRDERKFPVDYDYSYSQTEKVKMMVADCFQISEKPSKAKGNIRGLIYNKIYFDIDNGLECQRNFKLRQKQFSKREYPTLKNMYDKVVNSDQDQLVLVRK
jgi:hypothetical protein